MAEVEGQTALMLGHVLVWAMWTFICTGAVMLAAWVSWEMHDRRQAERRRRDRDFRP